MPQTRRVPIDRTKREHIAVVDRVIFSSPEGFHILGLTDGLAACGEAAADTFERGTRWRFMGRWQENPKHGWRFHWQTFISDTPLSRPGVVKYLTKTCDGIGMKLADRLYDKYGGDAIQSLREVPQMCAAEISGLSHDVAMSASDQLKTNVVAERTKVDLFGLFAGRGFPGRLIERSIAKWGAKAPQAIQRNPFAMLIAKLPGCGFKRCDRMYLDLGHRGDSLKRQAICAWNECRADGSGHTWLAVEDVAQKLRDAVPSADPKKAFRMALRARLIDKRRDDEGKLWLADMHRAIAERRIALNVKRLSAHPNLWPRELPVSKADGDGFPSEHQVERALLATAGPVGILCGSPGTGKTHTLRWILAAIMRQWGRESVCLCAPTGKAAVRMTQAIAPGGFNLRAKTIHSTLEIGRNGHDGEGWGFRFNRNSPLPYRFVVVDETSMVDAGLMADLLDACGDTTQVLLIGDPYQLPPVGHGAPLRDLIAAGLPCGELTHVRRNAGAIVHACLRIKCGESFETSDAVDLDAGKNLRLIETGNAAATLAVLEKIVQQMTRFDPVRQAQVLVATNDTGDISRKNVNGRLHKLLNPDGVAAKGNPWRVSDKVICLRNTFLSIVEYAGPSRRDNVLTANAVNYEKSGQEAYVANGEIGFVEAVGEGVSIVRFSEGEQLVRVPMSKPKHDGDDQGGGEDGGGSKEDFDLAYAITAHKSQGSESPCVIILIDDAGGRVASREWHYTAISRASKLCILIGRKEVVEKQAKRVSLIRRKTFLKELIHEHQTVSAGSGEPAGSG